MPQPSPLQSLLPRTLLLLLSLTTPPTTATPTHLSTPLETTTPTPQNCFNISNSLALTWTAQNFTFNSTQVTPSSSFNPPPTFDSASGSGYIPPPGPNKGEVFFNLTNSAINYTDSCAGHLDTTTYDSGWFLCQDPNSRFPFAADDTSRSAFRFNAVTGMLEINQTWGCKADEGSDGERVWFQATGSINITAPCHIYYWANWTTSDVSPNIHDCETQNLTIVPDNILEIGGAMRI